MDDGVPMRPDGASAKQRSPAAKVQVKNYSLLSHES
jgi:hypothetical protein